MSERKREMGKIFEIWEERRQIELSSSVLLLHYYYHFVALSEKNLCIKMMLQAN